MNKNKKKFNRRKKINLFTTTTFNYRNKKVWLVTFIPPLIITLTISLLALVWNHDIFEKAEASPIIFFGGFSVLIFIFIVLIDSTIVIIRDFKQKTTKGKIIAGIIMILFILRAIGQILLDKMN